MFLEGVIKAQIYSTIIENLYPDFILYAEILKLNCKGFESKIFSQEEWIKHIMMTVK